jgi:hypothetical protein
LVRVRLRGFEVPVVIALQHQEIGEGAKKRIFAAGSRREVGGTVDDSAVKNEHGARLRPGQRHK